MSLTVIHWIWTSEIIVITQFYSDSVGLSPTKNSLCDGIKAVPIRVDLQGLLQSHVTDTIHNPQNIHSEPSRVTASESVVKLTRHLVRVFFKLNCISEVCHTIVIGVGSRGFPQKLTQSSLTDWNHPHQE